MEWESEDEIFVISVFEDCIGTGGVRGGGGGIGTFVGLFERPTCSVLCEVFGEVFGEAGCPSLCEGFKPLCFDSAFARSFILKLVVVVGDEGWEWPFTESGCLKLATDASRVSIGLSPSKSTTGVLNC